MVFKSLPYNGKTCYLDQFGLVPLKRIEFDGVTYFVERSQVIGLRIGEHPVDSCTDFYRLKTINKNGTATLIPIDKPRKIRELAGLDPDERDKFWEDMAYNRVAQKMGYLF